MAFGKVGSFAAGVVGPAGGRRLHQLHHLIVEQCASAGEPASHCARLLEPITSIKDDNRREDTLF
jgi:hypothetical protein